MPSELRVSTYNIRYGTARDGAHEWRHRRDAVRAQLSLLDADVYGLQEVLADQRGFLADEMPDTRWYGVGRTDGERDGEQCPIVVRGSRLVVSDWSTLWLSEQPYLAGSRGWDATIPRVATVLTGTVGGVPVGVVNTHLDHRGAVAQVSSARLIADLVRGVLVAVPAPGPRGARPKAVMRRGRRRAPFGYSLLLLRRGRSASTYTSGRGVSDMAVPVQTSGGRSPTIRRRWIVLGDFNVELGTPALGELTRAGLRSVLPDDAGGTFHAWSGATDRQRIDHILVDDGWEVVDGAIVHDRPGGRLPSDHWPITAGLRLAEDRTAR